MIEFVIKVTLLLSLAGSLSFFPRMVSAEVRSIVTLVSFVGVLVLLTAMLTGREVTLWQIQETTPVPSPAQTSLLSQVAQQSLPAPQTAMPGAIAPSTAWFVDSVNASIAWWVFAMGAVLLLLRTVIQTWRCHRFVRALPNVSDHAVITQFAALKSRVQCSRQIELKQQQHSASPFTWGTRHPVLALPMDFTSWTESQQRQALLHELAHIQRYHCVTLTFMQIATSLLWWHPLAWCMLRNYRQDIERVCDDDVISAGAEPRDYATHLIEVARHNDLAPGLTIPMAAGQALKSRISALLAKKQRRSSMTKKMQLTTSLAIMCVAYVLGVSQVSASPPVNRDYLPVIKFAPIYPVEAKADRVEGFVLVEFDVDKNGVPQNINVIDQKPADGTFSAAALEAVSMFYYLPSREAGENIVTPGIRNRITFALDKPGFEHADIPQELAALAEYSKTSAQSKRDFLAQLAPQIEQAAQAQDGHRFVLLADYAMETDPSMAEYLFLRASQIGSSKPDYLKTVGGKVMFNRGALAQAKELFSQVSARDAGLYAAATQWVTYLEREIKRRNAVRDALMDLHS